MKYKRIVLKLSGEALSTDGKTYTKEVLKDILFQIKTLKQRDIQISIVIGGGNIFRGKVSSMLGFGKDTANADYMGMQATIINAFALANILNNNNVETVIQNALDYEFIKKTLDPEQAKKDLFNGKVVIFSGGTGKPYVSTDTAAAERAIEVEADVILVAKNGADGVYNKDPNKYNDATFINEITFNEIIEKELEVLDKEAMELLKDKNIDIILFNMNIPNNIVNIFEDKSIKKTIITRTKEK